MGLWSWLKNVFSSRKEQQEIRVESSAIAELNRVVAEYQQLKPQREKARIEITKIKTVFDRQVGKDRITLADTKNLINMGDKEVKQFEREVTEQLWDLKRMIFNLNIIIRTEYHEMLLEVQRPLQSYSTLLDDFEKVFAQNSSSLNLDDKRRENLKKYFESIKNDYNTLVVNMIALTKHELTPISTANSIVTAQHMQQRSDLRKSIRHTTANIRRKFLATSKDLKKIKNDPTNSNQILISSLDNTKNHFEELLTLFSQRGTLAKKMVVDAEVMRANTLKEIIELKAVLDKFYVDMRFMDAKDNYKLNQLKAWEERNKAELNKDAYILAEEEQEEIKATQETQNNMTVMRDAFVVKTNNIINTIYGITGTAAAAAVVNNNIARNRIGNIANGAPNNNSISGSIVGGNDVNGGLGNKDYLGRVPNNTTPNSRWDGTSPRVMNKDPTNLLNKNGLVGNDSRILPEKPTAVTAQKTGILGWFRKKWFTTVMAGVFAFNIAGPTAANVNTIRNVSSFEYSVKVNSAKYYEEEVRITKEDIKNSRAIFSTKFDNKEGMYSKSDFGNELRDKIISLVKGRADSIKTAKFGNDAIYVVEYHPEKSSVTGTTCPSGVTRHNIKTGENNNSLGFGRANDGRSVVDSIINKLVNDSIITKASNEQLTVKSATVFDADCVEQAAINLNTYAISINRPDLVSNPKEVRKANINELKKFDNCLLLMSINNKSEYTAKVKNVMNPARGVDPDLVFTVKIEKKGVPTTPVNIPIMPVAASSEREFIEATGGITPTDRKKYQKPTNEKIKPQDWRNVKTKGGGNTRVRPGGTAFRSGRTGSRGDMNRGRNR